jgi:hypothetical protein
MSQETRSIIYVNLNLICSKTRLTRVCHSVSNDYGSSINFILFDWATAAVSWAIISWNGLRRQVIIQLHPHPQPGKPISRLLGQIKQAPTWPFSEDGSEGHHPWRPAMQRRRSWFFVSHCSVEHKDYLSQPGVKTWCGTRLKFSVCNVNDPKLQNT